MFQSIIDDIKRELATGNLITRLVIVNVGVFFLINVLWFVLKMANAGSVPPLYYDFLHFFSVSSSIMHNITHPWVFVTSIFLHEGFWHLLWNMLFLYWFGRIVADLIGEQKILPLYLLGGCCGMYFLLVGSPADKLSWICPRCFGRCNGHCNDCRNDRP